MGKLIRTSVLLASVSLVAACTTTDRSGAGPDQASAAAAKPQIGTFGFDVAGMDRSVAPGEDFYAFANGGWAARTPIPADKSNYGMFSVLADLSTERTRGLLEAARAQGNSKIGIAYAAYLDRPAIDAKGLAPVQPWLARIKALTDKRGYPALLAQADRMGIAVPVRSYVGQDDKAPETYVVRLSQGGLGMPDRDYYLSSDAKLVEARTAYQAHLARILTLAGEGDAAARAKAILDFETGIARAHWTRVESRNRDKVYNKMTVDELARTAPGFDFAAYLRGIGTPVSELIVAQPTALAGEAKLIAATPVSVLRDQLIVRSLEEYADVLPAAIDDAVFAFKGTVLSGTPEQEARWKRAVGFTSDALADEVSKVYVARYFPPETKAAADTLVKNVIAAMDRRIDRLDWMAPETKAKAHAKLAAFTPKIGYPDRWRDYSDLEIVAGDAFGNKVRAAEWAHAWNVGHLGKPLQRWEWGMTPMTVNAYANFGMVEIVFPAAILQPPFFDPNADPAVNYGGIGAVIGHELSHHFDDQGAKYNAEGRLTDWWTPADVAAFKQRTDALVAQYDAYEPLPGMKLKGALTLGENVADLAGLTVAHDAYLASLGGKVPPTVGGFTADQRFYLGWAQVWRRNYREADLRNRLLTDPHSPSQQRAWIVRNLDPWYPAFQPAPGSKLYLAAPQRVRIW
ncbi:peptidase M13 [Sphingomonas spermidinifaciens]|uniref:Peptidase M13 n=1 Tax=Sphingomonas spermidinifaciens TaxID=1141889 RepID=A0A2A4B256_9SPHN|nr:M13 family metallopeptidase [Sphingomonas spermidinifaciens]PCD01818.1 peptidase M13 [Sphingomonas spermidinifaciens]